MRIFSFSAPAAAGLFLLLLTTPAALAQDATGKVVGTVKDATGAGDSQAQP